MPLGPPMGRGTDKRRDGRTLDECCTDRQTDGHKRDGAARVWRAPSRKPQSQAAFRWSVSPRRLTQYAAFWSHWSYNCSCCCCRRRRRRYSGQRVAARSWARTRVEPTRWDITTTATRRFGHCHFDLSPHYKRAGAAASQAVSRRRRFRGSESTVSRNWTQE